MIQFYRREQVRSRRSPVENLKRTHVLTTADSPFDSSIFPDSARLQPVTFRFILEYDGTSFWSVVIGSTAFGSQAQLAVGATGTTLLAVAGNGTTPPEGGVASVPDTIFAGQRVEIVMAGVPGTGQFAIWLDGLLVVNAKTDAGSFGASGWHGGAATGGAAISDASGMIVSPVSVYLNQRPRQFPLDV